MSDWITIKARTQKEKAIISKVRVAKADLGNITLTDIVFQGLRKWLGNDYSHQKKQQIHFNTNSSHYRNDVMENLEKIRNRLKGEHEIKENQLHKILEEIVGRNGSADHRTIKKYVKRMKEVGLIKNIRPAYKTIIYVIETDEIEMLG